VRTSCLMLSRAPPSVPPSQSGLPRQCTISLRYQEIVRKRKHDNSTRIDHQSDSIVPAVTIQERARSMQTHVLRA